MSKPKSFFIEIEYEYENGIIKKSLKYLGNECVVIRQESEREEISIRIPRHIISAFMELTDE